MSEIIIYLSNSFLNADNYTLLSCLLQEIIVSQVCYDCI